MGWLKGFRVQLQRDFNFLRIEHGGDTSGCDVGAQNENEECKKVRERQSVNQRRESRRAGQGVFRKETQR